ncbi:hypothetical protein DQB62_04385 [Shigella flexneri]|nr:hypothetical protein [Shigella flexneri]
MKETNRIVHSIFFFTQRYVAIKKCMVRYSVVFGTPDPVGFKFGVQFVSKAVQFILVYGFENKLACTD